MQTYTTGDGKTPIFEAVSIDYDYSGILSNIQQSRARILQKCDVPSRADNASNITGVATDTATGWGAAENSANKKQSIIESCKMQEVDVVLAAVKNSLVINEDNPMLKLRRIDMQASIKRQKNYELTTKVNFFATAVSHGIYGLHALRQMNAFEDVNQVWEDSRPLIEAYQRSIFEKSSTNQAEGGNGEKKPNSNRLEQDLSDQILNSPQIDSDRS